VLLIEANFDIGGHAAISGGNLPLGGGSSAQKRAGIVDSPDLLFADLTDWSVVQPNGFPDTAITTARSSAPLPTGGPHLRMAAGEGCHLHRYAHR
jgi:hypothetical protein